MYLSQLKITGFKSFADSHTVDFNQGITAIVGPNGCGKSNIIDAIRWVLGEQRVRVLRSEKMEDVIFSGTIRRKPLNFSEVTLTIVNDRGILPMEYGTVHITRRIFRTGESDYFINKKLCRLKDIHNLFYDTGMGIGSYSLMEQKMIDIVLSDKDDERRTMFEEAAGINKYRNQRKEALKNLIKTTDDLQRLTDLLGEKDRTVKMLARHVTKARKYREFNDELTKLEVAFTGRYFSETGEKLKQAGRDHAALIADREKLNAEKSGAEAVVEEKELLALKKEERMSEVNQEISRLTEEIHEIENAVVAKKEKIESARRAIAQTEQYQQQSHANIERLKREQAVVEEHIIRLESGMGESEAAYLSSRQAFDAFDAEAAERRQALNTLQQEKIAFLEQEAALKSSLEKMKSTVDNLMENKIHQEQSISAEKDRLNACRENIRRCQESLKAVSAEYHNLSASRDALLSKIEEAENRYRNILEQEKGLEAQRISDEKKLEFIEEMKKNHEGYKAAVRSVIEGDIAGIQGIVADVIHVNPDHIVAIESALGSRVQYVLAENEDAALAAVDFLREGKLGKASFAVQHAVKPIRRSDPLQALETLPGVIGWADRFVSFKDDYQALASMLLGDVLLIDNPGVLQDVRARCGDFNVHCITPDGSVFTTHGIIRGGEFGKEDVGLISQSKFIETLNENTRKCRDQIDEKVREKKATLATLEEAKKALFEIDERLNTGSRTKQEHEGNIRHLDEEIMRIQARENEGLERNRIIDGRLAEIQGEETALVQSLQAAEEKKRELEGRIVVSNVELEAFEEKRAGSAETLKNTELTFSSLKQDMTNRKREMERLAEDVNRVYESLSASREEKNRSETEIGTLQADIQGLEAQRRERSQARQEKERDAVQRRDDLAAVRNDINDLRQRSRTHEKALSEIQEKLHASEMEMERLNEARRSMVERIWERYEKDLASLSDEETRLDVDETAAKERIEVLKKRLKAIGPNVNLSVLEDYETEKASFDELSRHKADLEEAKDKLEKLIRRLDREASEKFMATFNQVRENFMRVFLELFDGGEADIRLEEDPDPLKAKIAVYARPSGKSMKSISLLSGGERALTATSLLFGLYLVKRSPYCILDEVDGPLDDANIGRFVKLIRHFSKETQFLIITHNKKTMVACDILYGVTLAEPGISKLVSVSLDSREEEKKLDALIGQNA